MTLTRLTLNLANSTLLPSSPSLNVVVSRTFMGWFVNIWNKYDQDRVSAVGPDRACAEWVLRCGGSIQWKGAATPLKDYNALPIGDYRQGTRQFNFLEFKMTFFF